ncbi:hypothetical protein N3K66_005628 [Trichothecium roseum]|uniref:Uncharacterized protein n=1 Tax=Trichothecium roseum TaxID=47278 RepID=A0ACC0UYD7_9HYPO|nr:hypothetical protein N3K66_005628 [Trichothecium roseum]
MASNKDHWSSTEYQKSADFVPKLAGKVVQWLDLQEDDVLLDIGCGDGILNAEFAKVLSRGGGSQVGIDSSPAMIRAAQDLCASHANSTFKVADAANLSPPSSSAEPSLQPGTFTKVFSNAAMHWILRDPSTHDAFFASVASLLRPGGTLAFEMGGLGNVSEMRAALHIAVTRRLTSSSGGKGYEEAVAAVRAADPWFFGDEAWARRALEAAGLRVDAVEREWRPTPAGEAGVRGWLRLMGARFLDLVPDEEGREAALDEAATAMEFVSRVPGGGEMLSYVRLRARATKVA